MYPHCVTQLLALTLHSDSFCLTVGLLGSVVGRLHSDGINPDFGWLDLVLGPGAIQPRSTLPNTRSDESVVYVVRLDSVTATSGHVLAMTRCNPQ